MRSWYEALEEDKEIDLIETRKSLVTGITVKTLSGYRNSGLTVQSSLKQTSRKQIVDIVRMVDNEFNKEKLQEYLDGKHVERPLDHIKIQSIKNIRDALLDAKQCGVDLGSLAPKQPDDFSKLPEWIYSEMRSNRWHDSINPFLERTRIQLNKVDDAKVFSAVKELHKAIAPLIIMSVTCVKDACEKLSSLKGVDQPNGPAIAALAIAYSKGLPLSFEASKPDGKFVFNTPDNAIVEKSFSAEDDVHERVSCRILQKKGLLENSVNTLVEDDWNTIKMLGERNDNSVSPLFIYLSNEGVDYDLKQLEAIKLPGFYKFSSKASNELEVTGDEFAIKWLLMTFNDLYEHEVAIVESLRQYILGMSSAVDNEEIHRLKEVAKNISNDRIFLDTIEGMSGALSSTTQTAVNLTDAINNSASMFETAQSWITFLTEFTKGTGAG